ncbi:MAG: hypothetical protein ACR2LI_15830 [Propionibacteriaceae bacterium]
MADSWSWRAAEGRDPGDLGLKQPFPTQGEAESWLGEVYPDLRAAGVLSVSLYEDERLVYGPMSLDP